MKRENIDAGRSKRLARLAILLSFYIQFGLNNSYVLKAQNCMVYGYVKEKASNEPIIGAYVFTPTLEIGTTTNTQGFYSLSIKCGTSATIIFQSLGFQSDTLSLKITKDSFFNRVLDVFNLTTVEVSAEPLSSDLGHRQISIQELEHVPNLLGEPDPIKSISLLPGIASGPEGTVGLHVRGGSPDQNLFLLDGSTIYNNGHLFGFISVFSSGVIKTIDVYKGYFPSRYGGRLSSILDITMKDGNRKEVKKEGSFGLINSNFQIEGPLSNGKGSYILSGRAAHSGIMSLATLANYNRGEPWIFAGMYDFNGKLTYVFPNESKLSLSLYAGDDFWGSKVRENSGIGNSLLTWGNKTISLRYTRLWSKKLFGQSYLNYNQFTNNFQINQRFDKNLKLDSKLVNKALVEEWSFRQQLEWSYSAKGELSFGGRFTAHHFLPVFFKAMSETVEASQKSDDFYLISVAAFVSNDIQLERVGVKSGMNWSIYSIEGNVFQNLEPRIQLSYSFNKHFQWQASYSRMIQYIHLVTTGGAGLPYDFWLPAIPSAPPQQSDVFATGLQYSGSKATIQLEAFYKKFKNQVDLPSGNNLVVGNSKYFWAESLILNGEGKAYGLEFLLEKKIGKLTGWIGYTWSRSFRQFQQINQGESFPYNFDRPHDLELAFNYQFSKKWSVSSNFVYQTGRPISIPEALIKNIFGRNEIIYLKRNNSRVPDYNRLDVQFSKNFKTKKKNRDATLSFGLYNAYGRPNTQYLDLGGHVVSIKSKNDGVQYFVENYHFFRFIPSVNYKLKW